MILANKHLGGRMSTSVAITKGPAANRALVCPNCRGQLALQNRLVCQCCARTYEIVDGIPCFSKPDSFYDAYAQEHCPFAASPTGLKNLLLRILPFWSWREWDFWRWVIPQCDRLLDFGCGRGREVFLRKSKEIVGYDGSLAFLQDCAKRYSSVALGQLPRLPFQSSYFD